MRPSRCLLGSLIAMNCLRCGQPAFAVLKIEAMVDQTRLKVSGVAEETGTASGMIELADFFKLRPVTVGTEPVGMARELDAITRS